MKQEDFVNWVKKQNPADIMRLAKANKPSWYKLLQGKDVRSSSLIEWMLNLGFKITPPDSNISPTKEVQFVNTKVINAGENLPNIIPDDYLAVPLCTEAGAGPGLVQYEEFQSWFLVYRNEPSIRMRSNLIAVKIARGSTSMIPTLAPGDIVLVDRGENTNPIDGKIYLVAEPDGSSKVKRVKVAIDKQERRARIIFYSDNVAENPPEMFCLETDYEDDITRAIIGRVVWAWSDARDK